MGVERRPVHRGIALSAYPGGSAAVSETGLNPDKHLAGAEGMPVGAAGRRVNDPLPGRRQHQLAQHVIALERACQRRMECRSTVQGCSPWHPARRRSSSSSRCSKSAATVWAILAGVLVTLTCRTHTTTVWHRHDSPAWKSAPHQGSEWRDRCYLWTGWIIAALYGSGHQGVVPPSRRVTGSSVCLACPRAKCTNRLASRCRRTNSSSPPCSRRN